MTERGESPPDGGRNKVGEGAGHKVKKGKGGGYARSTHMQGDVGPKSKGAGGGGGAIHTGIFKTAEHKGHGSSHKLPMEKNVPFRKGIASGDSFDKEINQHFPNKKGVAGINKTAMPHAGSPVESQKKSESHGRASGKAEHHPDMQKAPMMPGQRHPQGVLSHGYGHSGDQRRGVFRVSGHKDAHQLGRRCK